MDIIFFLITIIFIIFLILSYYLDVIRFSVPLIIIYFIFCFTYLINIDHNLNKDLANFKFDGNVNNQGKIDDYSKESETVDKNIVEQKISSPTPKPIVSFNPKPIFIDSNIIINKDIDKNLEKIIIEKDTSNNLIVKNKEDDDISNNIKLNEIMICRGVYKRNPIKPGFSFFNNVDSLFCYTKISNSGSKQEIKHIWFYEDKEISSVIYNIKTSYNYRSWSKKTIYPKQIGNWRVDVVNHKGKVLGSRDFSIKPLNSTY